MLNTSFGHAVLTMITSHLFTTNSGTYTDLINPGDRPIKPNHTGGVTTRSATEAVSG